MFTIAIHGGAGSVTRKNTTEEQERNYHLGLQEAIAAGYNVLAHGGSALDAVEQSVAALEDNPLFNAGKGSVYTAEEKHEMDAAMMCGQTLKAGAAAGIKNVRNPIRLARAVLEKTENVILAGQGAEAFAHAQGLSFEDDSYFHTEKRYKELSEARKETEHANTGKGTVGAVAIDEKGNLAVATSTGGITNKKFGRVGDSAIIGGGTYANNDTCAVSCTGDGEYFIRLVTAYDVSCRIAYEGLTLKEACKIAVLEKLTAIGGEGGLIAIDRHGNFELVFNCESMLRAWKNDQGDGETAIW